MLRLRPFRTLVVETVEEASVAAADLGDRAALYWGGTELILALKLHLLELDALIDLKRVDRLAVVRRDPTYISIGAGVTHRRVESSAEVRAVVPALAQVASRIGNPRVRSAGTIGGSLCFGDPRSDLSVMLCALDASYVLESAGRGARTIAAGEWSVEPYEVAREIDEVMTEVRVPIETAPWRFAYEKFQLHERPVLGVAVGVRLGEDGGVAEARVAVGGGGLCATRLQASERELLGVGTGLGDRVEDAALAGHPDMSDDEECSALYKANLFRVLLRRATLRAAMGGQAG